MCSGRCRGLVAGRAGDTPTHRRCEREGCLKAAVDAFRFCKAHGGGKRCTMEGCNKSAQGGGSAHCITHGGGRRCTEVRRPIVSGGRVLELSVSVERTQRTPISLWRQNVLSEGRRGVEGRRKSIRAASVVRVCRTMRCARPHLVCSMHPELTLCCVVFLGRGGGGLGGMQEGCSKRAMQGAAMRCQEHGGEK